MTIRYLDPAAGPVEPEDAAETIRHLERRLAEAEAELARLRTRLARDDDADSTPHRDHRRSHALLAAVVTASHDAIVSSDEQHRITTWNPGAERIFGYTAQEAIGQTFSELIPADQPDERRDQILRNARAGATLSFTTRRRRKDGTMINVEAVVSPMRDADGAIIGLTSISRDITITSAW